MDRNDRFMLYRFGMLLLLLGGLMAGPAQAQVVSDLERSRYGQAAYYNYAEPGDVTLLVNVWGTVRNPGLYEIPQRTRLSTLLSVAGGPIVGQRSRREDRAIQIRLYREEAGGRQVVFDTTMENELFATNADPELRAGDILVVETLVRQRLSWRDVFPIVGAAASVTLIIERLL